MSSLCLLAAKLESGARSEHIFPLQNGPSRRFMAVALQHSVHLLYNSKLAAREAWLLPLSPQDER
jgi:hypothetical protein